MKCFSGFLLNGVTETFQNEVNEQKGGFLSTLLGTLGSSLLGNLLTGKGINRAGEGIVELITEIKKIIKRIFNAASSFNKF